MVKFQFFFITIYFSNFVKTQKTAYNHEHFKFYILSFILDHRYFFNTPLKMSKMYCYWFVINFLGYILKYFIIHRMLFISEEWQIVTIWKRQITNYGSMYNNNIH